MLTGIAGSVGGQTWTGATNSAWENSSNWSPNATPGNWASRGAIVYLNDTPGADQTISVGYDRQLSGLQMTSAYDYTLNSGELKFNYGDKTLSLNGAGDLIVNANVVFTGGGSGNIAANGSGVLYLNGNVAGQGGTEINFSGSGETVVNGGISGGSMITLSGTGTNTFNGSFGGGTTINVDGGNNIIGSDIGGGANISVNVSSGSLSVEGDIGGGAAIDVSQGQLALSGTVGSGAGIAIANGGTLLLEDGADLSGGGTNVELNGGTLAVTADEVNVYSLTLSADSVIDLMNDEDADVYFGNISGDSVVNIVNYNSTDQLTYNVWGSTIDVPTQIYFDGVPGMVINGNQIVPSAMPIPEPGTMLFGGVLSSLIAVEACRRRILNGGPVSRAPLQSV